MKKDAVVFYHANCPDGFGAAFAAWLVLGDKAHYIPCKYGDEPMNVSGLRVFILDFAFDTYAMARLDHEASSLVLLDHHKTSRDKLHGFKCRCGGLQFDLTRSGARLAWDYFHPEKTVPKLISHIQDRDLWKWELPQSAGYLSALDALGYDFEKWQQVLDLSAADEALFLIRGNAMNEKYQALCDSIAETAAAMPATLLGHKGLMVNASTQFTSDVGSRLASRCGTFGLIWKLETPSRVKVSLRSVPAFDVEVLARAMGGGGHPNASSFYIPFAQLPDLIAGTLEP